MTDSKVIASYDSNGLGNCDHIKFGTHSKVLVEIGWEIGGGMRFLCQQRGNFKHRESSRGLVRITSFAFYFQEDVLCVSNIGIKEDGRLHSR